MKPSVVRLLLLASLACSVVPWAAQAQSPEAESNAFDAELAAQLGADNYGMRRYIMVMLLAGEERGQDPERVAELQRGHFDNMRRLADEGLLVLAGPFLGGGERRGIFIFAVDSVDAAKELTASDPAIQAGRLKAEYWPWYGSAALMQVGDMHERIAKEQP